MATNRRKDSKGRVLKDGERERKDGTYEYRYTNPFGRRKSVYAPTLNELREKEKEVERLVMQGVVPSNITVGELFDRFQETKINLRPQTLRRYDTMKRKIDNQYGIGYIKVTKFTVTHAKSVAAKMVQQGMKASTMKQQLSMLASLFEFARESNLIASNPFSFQKKTLLPKDDKKEKFLTAEQQRRLLDFAAEYEDDMYVVIMMLLNTGLRIGEFCGLTFSEIDFDNKTILVQHQLVECGNLHFDSLKTESSRRTIPMNNAVYDCLIEQKNKVKNVDNENPWDDIVFLQPNKAPYNRTVIFKRLQVLKQGYNQENPDCPIDLLSPHVLRHTFCTNLILNSVNPSVTQYLMGHSYLSTTLNIYTHFDSDKMLNGNIISEIR